ncbi:MAG: TIM barrel protein [Nanoarchaeota archaeon]
MNYWESDYWHSLDKPKDAQALGISTDFISTSTHPFKEQLQELKAKIFSGVKNVEISFIATGKSPRSQGPTPEQYGKAEREELRQLAKVNDIELTTHSPANAPGLSGFSERGFSQEVQEASLKELKRTIEFAADVARGGPIAVHTQEFPRAAFEAGKEFEAFPEEKEKAPIYFVNQKTGAIEALPRDHEISVPEGGFQNPKRTKEGFVEKWEKKKISEFEEEALKKGEKNVAQYIFKEIYQKDLEFAEIEARHQAAQAKKIEREAAYLENTRKELRQQEKSDPEKAHDRAMEFVRELEQSTREVLAPRYGTPEFKEYLKNPIKYVEEIEERTKRIKEQAFEAADQAKLKIEDTQKKLGDIKPIEEFALGKTSDAVARAAMFGYNKETQMKKEGVKDMKPIVICPENVWTEYYGGHPKELKNIITKSRQAFSQKLVKEKNILKVEADKIAEERIKATFDIGHVNVWRKWFKEDDPTGEKFNKWVMKEVDELVKDKIIGHVHINDNFGYEDIHIAPGQGNAPIKEFVDKISKAGFKGKMVVEAGGQREDESVLSHAWKTLGSPIYRIDSVGSSWTDISGSYFGRTGSPSYLVGDLAPSKDWTLWSETQLE